jgi:hypothetical protein
MLACSRVFHKLPDSAKRGALTLAQQVCTYQTHSIVANSRGRLDFYMWRKHNFRFLPVQTV